MGDNYDDDLAGDDMGYDLDTQILSGEFSEMGAAPRARTAMVRRPATPARRPASSRAQQVNQRMTQLQSDGGGMEFQQATPFSGGTLSVAAGATLNMTALPQRKFQLQRLILNAARIGTTSATASVVVTQLLVGATPQTTVAGNLPVEMFAATAVGVRLFCNAARPGITLTASIAETGVGGTDTIIMSGAGIGPVLD